MTHACSTCAQRPAVRTASTSKKPALPNPSPFAVALPLAAVTPPLSPSLFQSGDRLLRLTELTRMLGVSRSTVYRYLAVGRLPPPVHLSSRCIAWKASTITAWMDALAVS